MSNENWDENFNDKDIEDDDDYFRQMAEMMENGKRIILSKGIEGGYPADFMEQTEAEAAAPEKDDETGDDFDELDGRNPWRADLDDEEVEAV